MSYLHFPVSHSMAPVSHLLVYYVRENGEGVTDSVQIPVQPDFENQVRIVPERVLSMMFCSVGVSVFRGDRASRLTVAMVPCVSTYNTASILHFLQWVYSFKKRCLSKSHSF